MSEQRHIIKRQTIELKIDGSTAKAQALQAEISRIYRQRIVPLINEYCTALSDPDQIHRLELLEIDLGSLDPQRLEADFVTKISATLYNALATQINKPATNHQKPSLKIQSQLELLSFFVQTGNLPWWADMSQTQLLEACLQYLIEAAPESLRRMMGEWVQEKHCLQRIVNHYGDELLAKLSALLAPSLNHSLATDLQLLSRIFQKSQIAVGIQAPRLKQQIWHTILQVLGIAGTQFTKPDPFYQAVLTRLARELGMTYKALLVAIHQVLPEIRALDHSELKNSLEILYWEQVDRSEAPKSPAKPVSSAKSKQNARETPQSAATQQDILRLLRPLIAHNTQSSTSEQEWKAILHQVAEPAHWSSDEVKELAQKVSESLNQGDTDVTTLETFIVQLPIPLQEKLRNALQVITNNLAREKPLPAATLQEIMRLLRPLIAHPNKRSPNEHERLAIQQPVADPAHWSSNEVSELIQRNRASLNTKDTSAAPIEEILLDRSFSDTEELYISNAGLVILWPFLSHFFTNMDLLLEEKKQFKNQAAMQRAVGLQQYIATATTAGPEYLLALNKVLCGMAVTEVYQMDSPLNESEMEECSNLLKAVIAQAPILRDMSESGFRGTFLLRAGVLSTRDGAWLLRVERETYDIVLDSFPWNWVWVKLPWMEAPLRVEW